MLTSPSPDTSNGEKTVDVYAGGAVDVAVDVAVDEALGLAFSDSGVDVTDLEEIEEDVTGDRVGLGNPGVISDGCVIRPCTMVNPGLTDALVSSSTPIGNPQHNTGAEKKICR